MNGNYVYLRGLIREDFNLVQRWNFDEELIPYLPSKLPNSELEQKDWFERQLSGSDRKKLIICDKENDIPIGLIGIMQIDHINKNCEIGITIGEKKYHGQPHTKEAFRLALDFLFNQFNMHIVYLRVIENNHRAVRFFENFGFTSEGLLRDRLFKDGKFLSWLSMSLKSAELIKP